ncbi:MAG: proline dehydrogenase family protein [Bacteroidetes bacterium]|nr:proline dehydrogenase family protein [Bacteroidota bacterium]
MNILNKSIVSFVKVLPKSVVYLFAKKYIAGLTLQDAVNAVKDLNAKGIMATMDVLGESIQNKNEALIAKEECIETLQTIYDNKLDANLSIKPTQLGLALDPDFCYNLLDEIITKAKELDNFVRIDMEDSSVTQVTIDVFNRLREKHGNTGIVVQAYLKRTLDDVIKLNKNGTSYRLCKGIYVEPAEIAYKDRREVQDNFLAILKQMIEDGNYVGIATHDDYLVDGSYKLLKDYNLDKNKYEFQMLYGVKENLRDKIKNDGHRIRVYVPYGEHWYAYSVRRLQENPQLAFYIAKSVIGLDK